MSLSDEDKREIELLLREREIERSHKMQMWIIERVPFLIGGIFIGIMILNIGTCCLHK